MISTGKCLLYSSVTQQLIIGMENLVVVLALSFFSFLLLTIFFCHQTHLTKSRLFFLIYYVHPLACRRNVPVLVLVLLDLCVIAKRCGHVQKLKTTAGVCFYFLRAWHMTTNAAYGDAWFTVEKFVLCGFLSVLLGRKVLAHRPLFMRRHRK